MQRRRCRLQAQCKCNNTHFILKSIHSAKSNAQSIQFNGILNALHSFISTIRKLYWNENCSNEYWFSLSVNVLTHHCSLKQFIHIFFMCRLTPYLRVVFKWFRCWNAWLWTVVSWYSRGIFGSSKISWFKFCSHLGGNT